MDSPFKFLEAYGKSDRHLFFGRDQEIEELYSLIRKSNLVVVYGLSGVGKTSLIRCGLVNQFDESGVVMREIRRRQHIVESLRDDLAQFLKLPDGPGEYSPAELVQKTFNKYLRPIYLFFDQFEELFILGDLDEKRAFMQTVADIRELELPCTITLILRQEYLGHLTDLKREVPFLFDYTLQVRQMDRHVTEEVVHNMFQSLHANPPGIPFEFEPEMPRAIVDIVANNRFFVELPHLQVYLDKSFRTSLEWDGNRAFFSRTLIEDSRLRDIETVLNDLLDEQIAKAVAAVGEESEAKVLGFLKIFVTEFDTKQPVSLPRIWEKARDQELEDNQIEKCLEIFSSALLLRPLEGNQYELSHDSLAAQIAQKRPSARRVQPAITGNPYKGLAAFTESEDDIKRFFGRRGAIEKVLNILDKYPLAVISGASGTGKSSLVKAGVYPELRSMGYQLFEILRPGESPLQPLEKAIGNMQSGLPVKKGLVLLVDQYEELITRSREEEEVEEFINRLAQLIGQPHSLLPGLQEDQPVKIIITVRSDFEPQFKKGPLEKYWDASRFVVPFMTPRELEMVIEGPAELAACYFEPPSLIKNIAEEVSGRPSALPLLSFALSEMFEASLPRRIITQDIYNRIGVFGALQSSANALYDNLPDEAFKRVMRQIMLRMVSLEGSEVASRRVSVEELRFPSAEENDRIDEVLMRLTEDRLIVRGRGEDDQQPFVEPAHDALLRGWTRLWEWIKDFGKEKILFRERLHAAVAEWKGQKKAEDALWREESQIIQLRLALGDPEPWLNAAEREFAASSVEMVEKWAREQKEKEEEKKNLVRNSQAIQEKSRRRKLIAVISFAASMLFFFVALAAIKNQALAKQREAEALANLEVAKRQQTAALESNLEAKAEKRKAEQAAALARENEAEAQRNKLLAEQNLARAREEERKTRAALLLVEEEKNATEEQRLVATKNFALAQIRAEQLAVTRDSLALAYQRARSTADSLTLAQITIDSLLKITQKEVITLNDSLGVVQEKVSTLEILAPYEEIDPNFFQKEISKNFGYRALWPPIKTFQAGDVGAYYKGVFVKITSLDKLGVEFSVIESPMGDMQFISEGVQLSTIATDSLIRISMPKKENIYFSMCRPVSRKIANLNQLSESIRKLRSEKNWADDYLVVTEVVAPELMTAVVSSSPNALIELKASGGLDLCSPSLKWRIFEEKNISFKVISEPQITPLIKTMGLRK